MLMLCRTHNGCEKLGHGSWLLYDGTEGLMTPIGKVEVWPTFADFEGESFEYPLVI